MRCIALFISSILVMAISSFTPASKLAVTSTAFTDGGMIPSKYSCQGAEVSPPLHIGNVPKEARSLALICHDPDAPIKGGFTHWVLWNIDVSGSIPENFKGAYQGLNGAKRIGYIGMCPPSGMHHYHFYAYALDTKLDLDKVDKAVLEQAMKGHIVAEGELTGLYKKS